MPQCGDCQIDRFVRFYITALLSKINQKSDTVGNNNRQLAIQNVLIIESGYTFL
jgi:hypothetical protein